MGLEKKCHIFSPKSPVVVVTYELPFLRLTLLTELFSHGDSLHFLILPITLIPEAGIHPAGAISVRLVRMVPINQMHVHQESELPKS